MEITVLDVALQLARHHDVTIVSRVHPRYPKHSVVSGVSVHRVPTGRPAAYLSSVCRFLTGRSYDVIQIDNRPRFVLKIKKLFPETTVSLFLHSLTFVSPPNASRAAAARGLKAADLIVANSESLKKRLSDRFPEAASKIHKVWLGVDTARFSPAPRNGANRRFTVLFAGRLIPRKGLPVLLKAAKIVRSQCGEPLQVIVAGGGRSAGYAAALRSLARRLRVDARFLGTVPHHSIHQIYRQADVFVCPSQKHESFGLVNVEALASGLPVIASDIGGIKEIVVPGRNGYLIAQYRKPERFADAILKLMRDPPLMEKLREQARSDSLKRFSWSATARNLGDLYARRKPGKS